MLADDVGHARDEASARVRPDVEEPPPREVTVALATEDAAEDLPPEAAGCVTPHAEQGEEVERPLLTSRRHGARVRGVEAEPGGLLIVRVAPEQAAHCRKLAARLES